MNAILCCLYAFTELSASVKHDNPTHFDRQVAIYADQHYGVAA